MERLRVSIPFFLWFPTFVSKHGLQNVFAQPSIQVQTALSKIWHLIDGSSVSAIHPPAQDLKLLLQGEPTLATPFCKGHEGSESVKLDDLKKVHQQLNYSYIALTTMATQLSHVGIRIKETKKQILIRSIPSEGSSYTNTISKPFFKTDSIPKKHEEACTQAWSNSSLINRISEQINVVGSSQQKSASCLDKTCVLAATDSSASEEDEEEQIESEEESLNVLSKILDNEDSLIINKIRHWNPSTTRNFYPRPTPPDIQYE